jgi:hypothetical protein
VLKIPHVDFPSISRYIDAEIFYSLLKIFRRLPDVQRWYAEYAADDEASAEDAGKNGSGTGGIRE